MTIENLEILITASVESAIKDIERVKKAVTNLVTENKATVQQATQQISQVAQASVPAIKQSTQAMRSLGSATKDTTAQQQVLIAKITSMKKEMAFLQTQTYSTGRVRELAADIEIAENKLKGLQAPVMDTGNRISDAFGKGIKTIRRFVLSLLGARAIWSLLSGAAREYIANNEQMRASMELTRNALGQMLAPAIKIVVNVLQYLLISLAFLIDLLFGTNLVAKLTAKSLNKTAGATKKLNRELTAMDEITNLSDKDTGSGLLGNINADFKAMEEFKNKIAEIGSLFDKIFGKDRKSLVGTVNEFFKVAKVDGESWTQSWWNGVKSIFRSIWLETQNVILNIWVGMKQLFSDVGKGLANIVTSIVNFVLEKLFGIKPKPNTTPYTPSKPSSGTGSGGGTTKITVIPLPTGGGRFATGTVAYQPTIGQFGEYAGANRNPEIVSPQSIMYDTMVRALSATQQQTSNNQPTILNINGKEIARAMYDDTQSVNRSMNSNMAVRRV